MTDRNESLRSDESLERLLGQAAPRPVPAAHDAELMRLAVHTEWRSIVRKRRTNRRAVALALAASVVVTLGVLLSTLRVSGPDRVAVATIARSFGSIYTLGDQSELYVAARLVQLRADETILTGSDSGMALAWLEGGSLRIDANTRVTFKSGSEIELHSGRVYFDSESFGVDGRPASGPLLIRTEFGVITHLGTRYMADASGRSLAVSVREGRVSIDGTHYDAIAGAGQQLRLTGTGRPVIVGMDPYGETWTWIERTSPPADMDGRSVRDFLGWASRESGLEIRFASAAAERLAATSILRGRVDIPATEAVPIWLQTTDLEAHIEDGFIAVSTSHARTAN